MCYNKNGKAHTSFSGGRRFCALDKGGMRPRDGGGPLQAISFVPIILMLVIIFYEIRKKKIAAVRNVLKNRDREGKQKMVELAKRFVEKECLIYAFDSGHQFEGVIKEVSDGAILIEKDGRIEAINLDYVIRIREYPKSKKGKKKTIVLD